MPTNFLEAVGNLSPARLTQTGNTHTNTTVDTLNFNPTTVGRTAYGGSLLKGQFLTLGGGGHQPDIIAAVTSTTLTLLTAASSTLTGTAVVIYFYPVLIGGEASALIAGNAVTSSYWNNTGIFSQTDIDQGALYTAWFISGGAWTPGAGNGGLSAWFLESWDLGTNFDSVLATPSTTVPALRRPPDFNIPLENVAYAAGSASRMANRYGIKLPSNPFRVRVQNNGGATMPATWAIILAPFADQY